MTAKPNIPRRDLNDIAEALRAAKDKGGKCTVLIGAGCSLSAGIPLSSKIVEDIHSKFPHAYARAQKKTNPPGYGLCMRELSPGQRRDLLKGYIDAAKINWAHIGLAQLVKHDCIDRILTTNFDPLIARACALANEFPAVYDLTASTYLRPEDLPDRAVFHLHGQRNGFVLLNESGELEKHAEQLKPVFAHAREGRVWIVVGYSGENDPLFRLIRDVDRYEYDLFWVDIKPDPLASIADFFSEERRTYYVQEDRGADIFFMALANELGAWPPVFVDQPFEHLRQQLRSIVRQDEDGTGRKIDWLQQAREKIDKAEACLKEKTSDAPQDDIGRVQAAFLEGGSEKALAVSNTDELKASLLNAEGCDLDDKALALAPTDLPAARELWRQAGERYAQALALKPDKHEAANNWGSALDAEAAALVPTDLPAARELWRQARERYAQALAIKPDMHEAANNWGNAFLQEYQAIKDVDSAAAESLLTTAEKCLRQAEAIKPGSGAYNMACVAALRGNVGESIEWLMVCQDQGKLPSAEHVRKDKDLAGIRATAEFAVWWQQSFGPREALE